MGNIVPGLPAAWAGEPIAQVARKPRGCTELGAGKEFGRPAFQQEQTAAPSWTSPSLCSKAVSKHLQKKGPGTEMHMATARQEKKSGLYGSLQPCGRGQPSPFASQVMTAPFSHDLALPLNQAACCAGLIFQLLFTPGSPQAGSLLFSSACSAQKLIQQLAQPRSWSSETLTNNQNVTALAQSPVALPFS